MNQRDCLAEFFKINVPKIDVCENCGCIIHKPQTKNLAHILPKRKFKSVMCHPFNKMNLCTRMDRPDGEIGCHETYDASWTKAMKMNIWETAVNRFKKFEDEITESSLILLKFYNSKYYAEK